MYRLQNLSKIHYYLKEDHDFLADEVAALLQFTDPLTVALECWKEQDHPWEFPICDILYEIKAYAAKYRRTAASLPASTIASPT